MDSFKHKNFNFGFTVLELLISIGVIALIAAVVFIALNPLRRFADSRNAKRYTAVQAVLGAIQHYMIDNSGKHPPGIDANLRMLGTATSTCASSCGAKTVAASFQLPQYVKNKINDFISNVNAAPGSGWVSPTGFTDSGNQWSNAFNAYDGNVGTYAQNNYGGTGWGQFIELNLSSAILSDRLRLNVDYMDAQIQEVDVDVYRDGIWVDVFQGGNQSTWNTQWVELTYTKGMVSKARFRYNYKAGGYYYWMYELQFYQSATTINPPSCVTQAPTLVQDNTAILHGLVNNDGGEPVDYNFQYGPTSSYGMNTGWISNVKTGDMFDKQVTALATASHYHFQGQLRNSSGTTDCGDMMFATQTAKVGWIPAVSFTDINGAWSNIPGAYDDNTATYAWTYHNINDSLWSNFIYLNYDPVAADKFRMYALGGSEVTSVDVDVYRDGVWVDVYEGSFADQSMAEQGFNEGIVTQARIRFYTPYGNHGFSFKMYEFELHKSAQTSITSCLNLTPYLVPKYLSSIPIDPKNGDITKTYYAVEKDLNNVISVYSCTPELNTDIEAGR